MQPISPEKTAYSAFDPAACVFVSANAGSGKTSLLTGRVLSLLLHGVQPSKILCLTFTNAAAAEMSNRILKELGAWVMADDEALRASVSRLTNGEPAPHILARARALFAQVLEAPEGVRIQTIHGFCQSLLRRFPLEAGVSPHFTVMDGRSEQEALAEARLRLFNHAGAPDSAIRQVLDTMARSISEHSFNALLDEVVKKKRRFRSLLAQPVEWQLYERFGIAPDTSEQSLLEEYCSYSAQQLSQLRSIAAQLLRSEKPTDLKTGNALARWLESPAPARLDEYLSAFLTQEGEAKKTPFTKGALADAALEDTLRAEQQRLVAFSERRRTLAAAQHSVQVWHIAQALLAEYDAIKRAHAWMDYDDLILAACDLLTRAHMVPWVLFKLDGGIDHILVDEAQDTSPEQWRIIQSLTQEFFAGQGAHEGDRSLFIVGDEKQSIYSFQGADVQALGAMQRYFTRQIEDALGQVYSLALTKSYRSTDAVLQAVDAIFARPEARAGLMFNDATLAHIPTRSGQPGHVGLWMLIQPQESEEGALPPATRLARELARTIGGWIENGQAQAGDIMVLVRSRTSFVDKLTRALKRRGVAVAGHDRMALGSNLAVQDLIALGQMLLLPEDDLTLAALLKSPICNMDEEALFTLAHGREGTLWHALAQRGGQAYALLAELRAQADFVPPFELYSHLLDGLGARARFLGRMGSECADPIDEFLNQALLYERTHAPSLQGFLHWLTHSDSEIKRDMEQAKNAVRIMTVHGAKGLQSKIVILPDTVELPRAQDSLLWLDGLPVRSPSSKQDDPLCRRLREGQRQAMLAEYRRLLYVALTRAEDSLYICGATGKEKISEQSWYHLVQEGLKGAVLDDGWRMTDDEKSVVRPSSAIRHPSSSFNFLTQPPPAEPAPSKPLTPSRLSGEQPASGSPLSSLHVYAAGQYIHLLLQHLPALEKAQRPQAALALARAYVRTLPADALEKAARDAMAVIEHPAFAFLFGADALAEVPVAGMVEQVAVSGQIDRLYIGEKEVWIVDFKSNQSPPAAIPDMYVRQLALYRLLLQKIYPGKTVRCGLLWTANAKLDVIPDALLDEWPASSYI